MDNILIVTVGTRDIQVPNQNDLNFREPNFSLYENKNIPGYKLFSNPFIAGDKILKYKDLAELVEYPIIKPAIDFLLNRDQSITDMVLICTDQENVEQRFKNSDTVHFAEIIKRKVREQYTIDQITSINQIPIKKDVTDYGKMYDFFSEELPKILNKYESCNLYLYPQGGIDAINFQALLKSIELFPNTYHLCKSEANNNIEESDFPYKFRTSIERQNILSLTSKFYYHEVFSIDPYIKVLASYAQERLLLNYDGAISALKNSIISTPLIEILKQRAFDINNQYINNEYSYLRDFYISVKITFYKKDYSAFILKMYVLCETFLKNEACRLLLLNDNRSENKIKETIYKNSQLAAILQKPDSKDIPTNTATYTSICNFFDKNPKSNDPYIKKTLSLRRMRNDIAHYARNSPVDEINKAFYNFDKKGNLDEATNLYFQQGDKFWDVEDFSDYEIINQAIKTRLLTNKTT